MSSVVTPGPAASADALAGGSTAYRWRWVILAVVLVAEIMDLLDSTVITIAAPTIRADLGGSTAVMQWWAAGYTLAFGVFLVVGGRLGDVLGRRRLFVLGMSGFTLCSAACALAPSAGVLIVFRVLQGACGAVLIPQGLGILRHVFPPKEMGAAFGAFGPIMGIAAIGGPILAGWLSDANLLDTGWRMIFLVNLPLGVAGVLGALRFVPENASPRKVRLDVTGIALMAAASFCIIYPLVQGRELGWPLWIFGMFAGGVALLGAFALAERRSHGSPLIEPGLLSNRAFTTGLLTGVVFFTAFGGLVMVFSMFTQLGLHFTPLHAGLTMAPMSVGAAVGAASAYGLMPRFGRGVLQAGLLLMVPAFAALALVVHHAGTGTGSWDMAAPLFVAGIGMGWVFGSMFNIILAGVQDHEVGSASGTLSAIQQLGNATGVAVLATIFFSLLDHGHTSATAIVRTLLVATALIVASFAASFLLPKDARMET
jgi:EmrB/QacA subfamily drug resistance transporter